MTKQACSWVLGLLAVALSACQPLNPQQGGDDLGDHFRVCTHTIERIYATPSGDWGMNIQYGYDKSGRLAAMTTHYFTFTGYDPKLDDFRPTNCERDFRVTDSGELVLLKEIIRDEKTKKVVKRSFYEPEVKHWMTLAEAQRESVKEEEERKQLENHE